MKEELTPADRVAQADLTKAILSDIHAKNKMSTVEKELQKAKIELAMVEARFSIGHYARYGRRWQNPFFAPLWKSFWFRIWRHDF